MFLVYEVGWIAALGGKPGRYRNKLVTTIQDYMTTQSIHVFLYDRKKKKRHKITLTVPTTDRDRSKL